MATYAAATKRDPELAAAFAARASHRIVADIAYRGRRYGLSEKQIALVKKIHREACEHEDRWAAERASAGPVPVGTKVEVEGVVLSAKWRSSQYGEALKVTVELANGSRVWGTCPRSVAEACEWDTDELKGCTIAFRASKVEASDDDRTFGFFKRPTCARVVAHAEPFAAAA
jgi:hypothetical protein